MRLGELFKDNHEARLALREFCQEQIRVAHQELESAADMEAVRHAQNMVRVVKEFQRKVKSVVDEGERDARRRKA